MLPKLVESASQRLGWLPKWERHGLPRRLGRLCRISSEAGDTNGPVIEVIVGLELLVCEGPVGSDPV